MKKFRYFILVVAGVAVMLGGCKDKEKYDESAFQDDLEPLSEDEVEALQSEEARRAEEIAERKRKSSKKSTQKRNQKPEIRKHRVSLQSVNSIRLEPQ